MLLLLLDLLDEEFLVGILQSALQDPSEHLPVHHLVALVENSASSRKEVLCTHFTVASYQYRNTYARNASLTLPQAPTESFWTGSRIDTPWA